MPAVDPVLKKPKRHRQPSQAPRNADTGDTSRSRPAPSQAPQNGLLSGGAGRGVGDTTPFAQQQQKAATQTQRAVQRTPRPRIAAPPVIDNPTPGQVQAAHAQIVASMRRELGNTAGAARQQRGQEIIDRIQTDPALARVRESLAHWQNERAKLTRPQTTAQLKPGPPPHKVGVGVAGHTLATINTTAAGQAGARLAAKVAPGLNISDATGRFVKNAFGDVGTIASAPFVGAVQTYGIAKDVVTGHPVRAAEKVGEFGKAIVQGTVNDWRHPEKYVREHPLLAALDVSGAESILGRTAGAVGRAAKLERASTVRPPLALGDDLSAGIVERRGSKDLIRREVQRAQDAKLEPLRDAQGNVVTVEQAGRQVPVLKPRDTVVSSIRHPKVGAVGALANKRADVIASRTNAQERLAREQEARDRTVQGVRGKAARDVVALVARGAVTSAPHFKTDLTKYATRLRGKLAQHDAEIKAGKTPTIYNHEGEVDAARANLALAEKVLANPKALAQAPQIVAEGERHGRALVEHDKTAADAGLFEGGHEQARRARLVETAVEHMDAFHGRDPRLTARIKQAKQVERSLRARLNFGHHEPSKPYTVETHHVGGKEYATRAEAEAASKAALAALGTREDAIANRLKADPRDTPNFDELTHTLREVGEPGIHVERDYKRFHARNGGGLSDQLVAGTDRKVVARGPDGRVQGVLHVFFDENGKPIQLSVAVKPELRKQGIGPALYRRAEQEGWDVEAASGREGLTEAGAALRHKRLTERAKVETRTKTVAPKNTRAALQAQLETTQRLRAQMEARNTERLRKANGDHLEPKEIEDFLRSRGRDPETVAYLPPNVAKQSFHKQLRPESGRGTLDKAGHIRTGAQALKGAVENTADILKAAGARHVTTLNKARSIDRVISEHGMRHPAFGKAARGEPLTKHEARVVARGGMFTGAEAAEVIARAAARGEHLAAVRGYPGRLDAQTQKIIREDLQGPGAMDTIGQRLLNDRVLTEDQLKAAGKTRNVVLVNGHLIDRLNAHLKPSTSIGKFSQVLNRAFRYAVLPTPRWMTGNFVEPLLVRMPGVGSGVNVFGLAADITAGTKGIRAMERHADPAVRAAAQEIRAHQFGGLLFGQRGLTNRRTLEDWPHLDRATRRAYAGMVAKLPATRHLAQLSGMLAKGGGKAFLAPLNLIFNINRAGESVLQRAAFGKSVRHEIQEFTGSWAQTVKLGQAALDDVAKGLVNSATQQRFLDAQHELLGKYEGFSPTMRAVIQGPAPFIPWALNAARFVFWTMPAHRSAQTALLIRLNDVVQKDWDQIHQGAPPGMKLALPTKDGGWVDVARYTPYGLTSGVASGDLRQITSQFLPQIGGTEAALEGKDPFGRDLQLSSGQQPQFGDKVGIAANSLAEALIPYLSNARRLQEHGETAFADSTVLHPRTKPGTSHGMSSLERTFSPIRPTYLSAGAAVEGAPIPPAASQSTGRVSPREAFAERRAARLAQQQHEDDRRQAFLERRAARLSQHR